MKPCLGSARGKRKRRRSSALLAAGAALAFALAPSGFGATLATYPFTGDSLASGDVDPDTAAGDLAVGAGLSGSGAFFGYTVNAPFYGVFSSATPESEALAISGNHYFSITITPVNGSIQFATVFCNLNAAANNIAGSYTPNVSIRWSVDNFATNLTTDSTTISPGQQVSMGVSADLAAFDDQDGPVEFRFYLFDNQNESQFTSLALDNLTLTGDFLPDPVHRPDASLGRIAAAPTGRNLFNLTAAGQSLNVPVRRGRGVATVFLRVANAGNQADSFRMRGTPGNSLFPVKYLAGPADATAPVTGGTYATGVLAPGAAHLLVARIAARRTRKSRTRLLFLTATSTTDPAAADRVLVRAIGR